MSSKKLITSTFGLLILLVAYYIAIEIAYHRLTYKSPFAQTQIWDHRGYQDSTEVQENSIQSYKRAVELGAQGVEIDVFYDSQEQDFVVSHDQPYKKQEDGSLLGLDTVFKVLGNRINYWLDLKNLNKKNLKDVSKRIKKLELDYSLSGKIFIETGNQKLARKLSKMDSLQVVLWVQYNEKKPLVSFVKKFLYHQNILFSNYSGLSVAYQYASEDFIKNFNQLPLFVFHLNTKNQIDSIAKVLKPGAVLLIDSPYYKYLK